MRVFVTGATGFIGSTIVDDLIAAGHSVLGLARSDAAASQLNAAGADVQRGSLTDVDSLRLGAAAADGVIHCAFIHDFDKYVENCEIDRRAILAMGDALAGTERMLVVTSGTGVSQGGVATEDDVGLVGSDVVPRMASEEAADAVAARGVRTAVVRLPQVHDRDKQGLVSPAIAIAIEKGVSAYIGDGENRWPAIHRLDVSPLYRLVLERGEAGMRYHAVAEKGVSMRDIAKAIGRRLELPVASITVEQAAGHFGWLAPFAAIDCPASSSLTRERLAWKPMQSTGLIDDLEHLRLASA